MTPKERAAIQRALESLSMYEQTNNDVFWDEAITALEKALAEQAKCKECGAKQAQIDRLMLEYCPNEMTPEQMQEWGNNQRPAEQAEQEPVAEAIAAEARLHRAVRAVASQAGESAEDTIEWLCNGGMAQLFECHFSGKNRESLCEDEGCPHRGVPHICIEKQAEQEPVAYLHQWIEYHPFGATVVGEPMQNVTPDSTPFDESDTVTPLYASPVRTKDLTDDEIETIFEYWYSQPETEVWSTVDLARAVIAADRELNK